MSKRAEQVALREYPPSYSEVNRNAKRIQSYKVDTHKPIRQIYIKGYKQAEKDTIERVVEWLKVHAEDYIVNMTGSYPDAPFNAIIGGKCWDELKKAMEQE